MPTQTNKPESVEAYLADLTPPMRETVGALRSLIREAAPELDETFKWGRPCYEHHGLVAYIKAAKAHVTFGFERGEELSDPEGLLEGSGKKMRHVKLRGPQDIRHEQFHSWLREAVALNAG